MVEQTARMFLHPARDATYPFQWIATNNRLVQKNDVSKQNNNVPPIFSFIFIYLNINIPLFLLAERDFKSQFKMYKIKPFPNNWVCFLSQTVFN